MTSMPTRRDLAELTIQALREMGGSAPARGLRAKVYELGGFSEEQLNEPGPLSSHSRSRISHGIDWALQNLRRAGLVSNDGKRPATWSLTAGGRAAESAEVFEALRGDGKEITACEG